MSTKTSNARTEAFFKALAETGNQTVSAERARVSNLNLRPIPPGMDHVQNMHLIPD